jgi:hypothetical protein
MMVYKGCQTGALYQAGCATARRIVAGRDSRDASRCDAPDCICGATEDMRFRRATPEEAEAFVRAADAPRGSEFWGG